MRAKSRDFNFLFKDNKEAKLSFFTNSFYSYLSYFADFLLASILLPFISRILGASEFGIITFIQSFGIIVVLIMEFGSSLMATREISIIRDSKKKLRIFINDILSIKIFILPVVVFFSILIYFLVPVFNENLFYLILVVFGSIAQGISPTWFFQGLEKMRVVAFSKIIFRTAALIIIISFVRTPSDGWLVLMSFSLSSLAICIYLFYEVFKKTGFFTFNLPLKNKTNLKTSLINFFITVIPSSVQYICVAFVSINTSPLHLGIYFGANRIYRAFNSLYSPISQAFLPMASSERAKDNSKGKILISHYLAFISLIGFTFFILNYFLSNFLVLFLLGNEFYGAEKVLKFFSFVLPLTAVSNAFGRQWLLITKRDSIYLQTQIFCSLILLFVFFFFFEEFKTIAIPISLIAYEFCSITIFCFFYYKCKN